MIYIDEYIKSIRKSINNVYIYLTVRPPSLTINGGAGGGGSTLIDSLTIRFFTPSLNKWYDT